MLKADSLFTVETARAIDRHAVEALGIPAYMLMSRAGAAAWSVARHHWPSPRRACVVCGPGNNGGDGLVFARLAREAGVDTQVVRVGALPEDGAAKQALDDWLAAGGEVREFTGTLPDTDLVVDALFGIGLSRPPEGDAARAIEAINACRVPVLALDVPSGVDADTGAVPGVAVRAAVTVTFIVHKRGLHTGAAVDRCGTVVLADLDLPAKFTDGFRPAASLIPPDLAARTLGPRRRDAHKGMHGHILVIGGAPGMEGAVSLVATAALRCGAGLVSVATHPGNRHAYRDELMVHRTDTIGALLDRATVVAVGPGLGRQEWGRAMYEAALDSGKPMVVDADALNLLAATPHRHGDWVLTPHPGEAARLLGTDTAAIQADRFAALEALAVRYGGTVVLKGAGTLVSQGKGPVAVCNAGNPGMASAGMGDVLTGVIAALLAQGLASAEAARAGVMLHARAADHAAHADGPRGLMAGDLYGPLRRLVNARL